MNPRVFISYSTPNFEFVKKLSDGLLSTKTISVWQDNLSIKTGDRLHEKIENAILNETDICLFYLSEAALISEWVRKEFEFAQNNGKHLYYLIDSEDTRKSLENWEELKGNETRIPVINNETFNEPLLELVSAILSTFYEDLYPKVNIESVLKASQAKGIHSIQFGRFTATDDARLEHLIISSTHIKVMMINANRFLDIFRDSLVHFLSKPNVKFQLLMANEDSDFYYELSDLISPIFNQDSQNKGLVQFAQKRANVILDESGNKDDKALEIRKYNTQFRLPIIIFDNKYVHLTINLPPRESSFGMTFEIHSNANMHKNKADTSYLVDCIKHFDEVWERSQLVR